MAEVVDLDALLPKPVKVKISGKVVDLYPGKLRTLVKIQDLAQDLDAGGEKDLEKVRELLEALSDIIPAIKTDKDIDISPLQVQRLIEIAYNSLVKDDSEELNTAKMNPTLDKKKEEKN
ncbi:MAG: hypothetical protein WC973_03040 [Candidatus Dojkabacteria bacterium]